jgi:phosphatidylinositol alpha-mannosyltransferase
MKIGLVLDASLDNPDGVQQYMIDIGEWLSRNGHDVHYLVGQSSRSDLNNIHSLSKNVGVKFNGNKTTIPLPTSKRKLSKFLNEQNFDILHVQVPYSPFLAHRIIMTANPTTAIVGTFHVVAYSKLVSFSTRILGLLVRSSLKKFDELVSTSTASAEFAKQAFGVDTGVLPCVIDYSRFHDAESLKKFSDDKLNILFLGRLVPRKGCQLLIEAVISLNMRKDVPAFRVIICGTGELKDKISSLVKNNNLEDIVSIEGFVDEEVKPSYYASADISVFPSSGGESFGIVLLEAMASGKSVVLAGNNVGYKTVMNPRKELLFNVQSSDQLADKLLLYLNDAGRRVEMKKWGEEYSKKFDVNIIGTKLVGIYKSAIKKRIG